MRLSLQTALQSIARTNVATTDCPYERLHERLRVALHEVVPQGRLIFWCSMHVTRT
jgi:hypothetical protein